MTAPQTQSIQEQNKQLLARWFDEVWNQGRRKTIHEIYGADAVLHDGKNRYRGPDEFCRFYEAMRAQFKDISIKPILALAEGDLACSHFSVGCTHIASGKPVEFTAMVIVRISDRKFTEAWQNWDAAAIKQQVPDFTV